MPELPEVEVTCLGLRPHLLQRRIAAVSWSDKRLRQPIPHALLAQFVQGEIITAVERRAKYLLIRLQTGTVLVVHLGMTGKLGMFDRDVPGARHDHLCLELDDGMEMRFNDARRFGSIAVWPAAEAAELERAFNAGKGVEPFGADFTATKLAELASQRTLPIKSFLMDSRMVAGIGNIYANETLFAAGIHPAARVNTLSAEQWQRIIDCCIRILRRAIAAGGSTISDFLGSSGQPGYFQLQLAVYGKKDEPCPVCSSRIRRESMGGRATFFCRECQLLDD